MKLNKVQAMDINQLDMVAGGSVNESVGDFDFLRKMGVSGYKYSTLEVAHTWELIAPILEKQWRKVGINCYTRWGKANSYSTMNGNKPLSRSEAFAMVKNNLKK